VANLSLRSTEEGAVSKFNSKVNGNLDQNQSNNKLSNSKNFPRKFNNNNGFNRQPQRQQQNNNSNSQGRNYQNNKFNNSDNFQNSQKFFNNSNPSRPNYSNNQNQFNRGRGSVRTNNNVVNGFVPTCYFCGIRGHYSNVCYHNPKSTHNRHFVKNFGQNNNNQFRPIRQNFNNQYRQQQQQPIYLQMPTPQGYQQAAIQNAPAVVANTPNIQYIPVIRNDQSGQNNNQRQISEN
jgi:hypothetical protein